MFFVNTYVYKCYDIHMRKLPHKGFTIVELLIVVVVIGILAAIVTVAYTGITTSARDTRRENDMASIAKALMLYNVQVGRFPSSSNNTPSGYETSGIDPDQFLDDLRTQGIIGGAVPVDPINIPVGVTQNGQVYNYYRYGPGSYGCDSTKGGFFVLGVKDMEGSGNPHPKSPGFACGTRDWQLEYDWVTGSFES